MRRSLDLQSVNRTDRQGVSELPRPSAARRALRRIAGGAVRVFKQGFCTEILVLGDSHVELFEALNRDLTLSRLDRFYFKVVAVGGATVSGLENPNARTQAAAIFERAIAGSAAKKAIVMLGEIDVGFVIWYRARKYGQSVDAMMRLAESNYERFILDLENRKQTIVVSSPLPTIGDDNDWGEVANARREVTASQVERTQLTLAFNKHMESYCLDKGIRYLNLDEDSIGKDGLVRRELVSEKRLDHHYNGGVFAALLASRLAGVL